MYILKEIKCASISLLKIINKNSPEAEILIDYADLLQQESKWCVQDKKNHHAKERNYPEF
jgi:hypothetical protein